MGQVITFAKPRRQKEGALTRLQLRVLSYMVAFEASKKAWPSKADIRAACNIRPRLGADFVVCQLVRRGAVPEEATQSPSLTQGD